MLFEATNRIKLFVNNLNRVKSNRTKFDSTQLIFNHNNQGQVNKEN